MPGEIELFKVLMENIDKLGEISETHVSIIEELSNRVKRLENINENLTERVRDLEVLNGQYRAIS